MTQITLTYTGETFEITNLETFAEAMGLDFDALLNGEVVKGFTLVDAESHKVADDYYNAFMAQFGTM